MTAKIGGGNANGPYLGNPYLDATTNPNRGELAGEPVQYDLSDDGERRRFLDEVNWDDVLVGEAAGSLGRGGVDGQDAETLGTDSARTTVWEIDWPPWAGVAWMSELSGEGRNET